MGKHRAEAEHARVYLKWGGRFILDTLARTACIPVLLVALVFAAWAFAFSSFKAWVLERGE